MKQVESSAYVKAHIVQYIRGERIRYVICISIATVKRVPKTKQRPTDKLLGVSFEEYLFQHVSIECEVC